MYSRKSWGGNVDPFILVNFIEPDSEPTGDPTVGLIIYEWQDEYLIGKPASPDRPDVRSFRHG